MDPKTLDHALVALRFSKLSRIPCAKYATDLMHENGIPVLCLQFGNENESLLMEDGTFLTLNLPNTTLKWPKVFKFLKPLGLFYSTWKTVQRILKKQPHCMIMAHGLMEQTLAWLFRRSTPYAVHVHEAYEKKDLKDFSSRVFFFFEKKALRNAKFLIFPEATRMAIYQKRYGLKNPCFVVPNTPRKITSLHPVSLRKHLGLADDAFLLGYWGGIGEESPFEETLRAVARIPQMHFLLWGWCSPEKKTALENLIQGLGIKHRAFLMGILPDNRWDWIAGLDLGYSLYNTHLLRLRHAATASNKTAEALACGLPVLVPEKEDFKKLVLDRNLGFGVSNFDSKTQQAVFESILANRKELLTKKLKAREFHLESYHYEKEFEPVLSYLQSSSELFKFAA